MLVYVIVLGVLIAVLVGLVVTARIRAKRLAGADTQLGEAGLPDELVARPTENLVDVADIQGQFLVMDNGELVAMAEIDPVLIASDSHPSGLDEGFARVMQALPPQTQMQIISMPVPTEIGALTERYARHGCNWREVYQAAQAAGDAATAAACQRKYYCAAQIGDMLINVGGRSSYRAAYVVLTRAKVTPADFELELQHTLAAFAHAGMQIRFLPPEEALPRLWYAYNPDHGAQLVIEQAATRFMEIATTGDATTPAMAGMTSTQLEHALADPAQFIKRVLAPAQVEEGEACVHFRGHSMLLYFVTDYRTQLPRIERLLGADGRYANRLIVSYYITAPPADQVALQARKASAAKQAHQEIARRMGTMQSYKQAEEVIAIEQTRHGAETEKNIPRLLGLYLGLVVPTADLAAARSEFEAVLQSAGLLFVPAKWAALAAWQTLLPLGQRHHHFEDRNVFSANLAQLNPLSGMTLFEPEGEFLGFSPAGGGMFLPVAAVRKRGAKLTPGDALVGAPGSGKSFTLKYWITDWVARGQRVIVLDPKLEFGPLADVLGGARLDALGGDGFNLFRFDPYPVQPESALGKTLRDMTYGDNVAALLAFYAALKGGRARVEAIEETYLEKALQTAMRQQGMQPDDPNTWTPDGVRLHDVYLVLAQQMLPENPAVIKVMVAILEQYADQTGQYFARYNTPVDLDLDNQLVAISFGLSQFSSDLKLPALAYHLALRIAAQHAIRTFLFSEDVVPCHIVIDEASQMLINAGLVESVTRMLSLLPAYNIQLHLAFQDMHALERADRLLTEKGTAGTTNTLLGTIPAYWLFRQEPHSAQKACEILQLPLREAKLISTAAPGECLLAFTANQFRLPLTIGVPEAFHEIFRTDPAAMRQIVDQAVSRGDPLEEGAGA
ncbi:MAG: hypothetical protein JXB38_00210 [Anaerolineales bacterium]|nr:hypothetical protein [Anaerolineales bacterium]